MSDGLDFDFSDFDFEQSPPPVDPLHRELAEIGYRAGQEGLAEGWSYAEATWRAVPHHAVFGGPVWDAIDAGVRAAYGVAP